MRGLTDRGLRQVLAWLVMVLLVVPVGGALWLGVAHGESPCILCWAQRTSMMLMALVALFVVRYGPRPRYLGMLILLAAWGTFMALRHSALHLARDIGQGFAASILGVHTYVWAWVIHWAVLLVAGGLLLVYRGRMEATPDLQPGRAARLAMGLLVVLAAANALQAFASTGPPPFIGQGDPIRLSADPGRWVWSMAELGGSVSLRGSWTVPAPDPASLEVDADPATGPLEDLPALPVLRRERITAPLEGRLTGFAASPDPAGGFLAVTEGMGVYVLDAALARVVHRVVLDRGFSIDLSPLTGAAWVGADSLVVLSTNKSYVVLLRDPDADTEREWRHFLESDGGVRELTRSRFATVRARQMYVLSLAYDALADEFITVSTPSQRHRRLVVSRFDGRDRVLSSEFLPVLGPGLMWAGEARGFHEFLVSGAAAADGLLYAVSAAHSTLLVIDLEAESVLAAYALPGLSAPVGLAVRGQELWVAEGDGSVLVVARPPVGAPPTASSPGSTPGARPPPPPSR